MRYDDGRRVHNIIQAMKPERLVSITHHLEQLHINGTGAGYIHLVRMHVQGEHAVSEVAAFTMGMLGKPFDMLEILRTAEESLKD